MSRLKRLIQEIHRRSLWQVLGIYLSGACVALQGIEELLHKGKPTDARQLGQESGARCINGLRDPGWKE